MTTVIAHDKALDTGVFEELETPVLDGPQAQGDIIVVPSDKQVDAITIDNVIVLARGDNGHEHALVFTGDVQWLPDEDKETIGWVKVGENADCRIQHTGSHRELALKTGTYEVRPQRMRNSSAKSGAREVRVID